MKWRKGRWWVALCGGTAAILILHAALAQVAVPPSFSAGTAGGACASSTVSYAWPDANGQILKCVANVWTIVNETAAAAGSTGQVQFNSSGNLSASSNLFWDNTNNRIGIGSSVPVVSLDLSQKTDALALPVGTTGQEPASPVNGMIRYNSSVGVQDLEAYINGAWTTLTTGGSGASIFLGASASAPDPARNGEANTGLYTGGSGLVDVSSLGTQVGEFSSTGLNLGTSTTTIESLKLGGLNGISYPKNDTNCIGCSVAIGPSALTNMPAMSAGTVFYANIAIGSQALSSGSFTSSAVRNIAIGYQAQGSQQSGSDSIAIGYQALQSNQTGIGDIAIGNGALQGNTNTGANIAIGNQADINGRGNANTIIGHNAMWNANANNVAVGIQAMQFTTGNQNVAVGANAGLGVFGTSTNADSVFIGYNAGDSITAGNRNICIGSGTCTANTTGNNNTIMGFSVASSTLATGSNNILIGTDASTDTPAAGTSNFLNIGNTIYATNLQNSTNTGGTANVGIGTTAPSAALDIQHTWNSGATAFTGINENITNTTSDPVNSALINLQISGNSGMFVDAEGNLFLNQSPADGNEASLTANPWHGIAMLTPDNGSTDMGVYIASDNREDWAMYEPGFTNDLRLWNSGAGDVISLTVGGNVGIGTTSPQALLHVGSASASGIVMELQNSSGACTIAPGTSSMTSTCSSDVRLKADIHDTEDALPWLADMRVRDFTVKATGKSSTGVIAQEMLISHPEMVHANAEGFYGVDVPNPWKIIKALQELKTMNEALKAANDNLSVETEDLKAANDDEAAEIKELRERLDALEAARP